MHCAYDAARKRFGCLDRLSFRIFDRVTISKARKEKTRKSGRSGRHSCSDEEVLALFALFALFLLLVTAVMHKLNFPT